MKRKSAKVAKTLSTTVVIGGIKTPTVVNTSRTIRNGSKFPQPLKVAALTTWVDTKRSGAAISAEYNVAKGTLARWVGQAGIQRGTQHPNLKAAIAARLQHLASIKAFNTPTVQNDNTIMYRGNIYR